MQPFLFVSGTHHKVDVSDVLHDEVGEVAADPSFLALVGVLGEEDVTSKVLDVDRAAQSVLKLLPFIKRLLSLSFIFFILLS